MNCLAQRKKFKNKHPVWSDPHDKKHDKHVEEEPVDGTSSGQESSDDDDDLDMYANDVRSKKYSLESKELRFKHLTNLNNERGYKGSVRQVKFHPSSKMALVTLASSEAGLFEVDGERNRYIQKIKFPKTKFAHCSFKHDGETIVISSGFYKGVFYTYDMISGVVRNYPLRNGNDLKQMTDFAIQGNHMACRKAGSPEIFVLSSKSYENTFSFKLNEPAKSMQFLNDNELFVAGENAQIYIWDLRKTSICKHKFQDDGSIHTSSLAISQCSNQISIGSDSGIVNMYELDKCMESKFPQPIKTFRNLKTPVDIVKYNPSGELLLFASRKETGALRMVHSHSGTVYKNFPTPGKNYGQLFDADFSPLSGYLALGCSTGRAHLCRIPYYKSY